MQKFTSDSSSWASSLKYTDILQLQGTPINSQVSSTNQLDQQIAMQNTDASTGTTGSWTYFMIKYIRNPAYQSQDNFTVDTYSKNSNGQNSVIASFEAPLNYTLNPPASDVQHTNISVVDNDVLYFTPYQLTYRLSIPLQTNQTTLYLTAPLPSFNYALLSLNCCMIVNSSTTVPYSYCNTCQIIKDTFKFPILQNGLKIPNDVDFKITINSLYNPPNQTDCTLFAHHTLSYFKLLILKADSVVTHSSSAPTNLLSPCQKYRVLRADIIPIFPATIYAGLVHPFTIKLS